MTDVSAKIAHHAELAAHRLTSLARTVIDLSRDERKLVSDVATSIRTAVKTRTVGDTLWRLRIDWSNRRIRPVVRDMLMQETAVAYAIAVGVHS